MTFSIDEEFARLQPLPLEDDGRAGHAAPFPDELTLSREFSQLIGRLGKQQLRANLTTEEAVRLSREALDALRAERDEQRDYAQELRRECERLTTDSRVTRLAALEVVDSLDDLRVVSLQNADTRWDSRVERLLQRALSSLASVGVTEVPSLNERFDERLHEAVGTVERGDRPQYLITEVVRRGFFFNGSVLRRAQVTATR